MRACVPGESQLGCAPHPSARTSDSSRAAWCLSLGFNYGYNICLGLYGISGGTGHAKLSHESLSDFLVPTCPPISSPPIIRGTSWENSQCSLLAVSCSSNMQPDPLIRLCKNVGSTCIKE